MTTRLELRVQKMMIGDEALSGAVADVLPLSSDDKAKSYTGVVIPVSSQETQSIDVEPGRYLVRAYLPSGSLLSQQVTVSANQTTSAVLHAEGTPHEWLGWQGLVQQRMPASDADESARALPNFLPIEVPPGPAMWTNLHALLRADAPASAQQVIDALQGKPTSLIELDMNSLHDARTASFLIRTKAPKPSCLRYGVVERGSMVDLISIPSPWQREHRSQGHGQANIDIAIPRNEHDCVGVAVQDANLGTLLGFIAGGRLPLAQKMSKEGSEARDQMRLALYKKVENPFAAAVGAYLLLQSDPRPQAEWHGWVENLAKWFPWLPDGAVLLGALELRQAKTDAQVLRARRAFEDAYARGIPVLAPVLRLLLDGASTLVGDPDTDAGPLETALPSIRSVAGALITNQAFTCICFGDH